MSARRRVWMYAAVAAIGIGVSAILTARPLDSVREEVGETHDADVAVQGVTALRTTLGDWQIFLEPAAAALSGPAPKLDPLSVAKGSAILEVEARQAPVAIGYVRASGLESAARELEVADKNFRRQTDLSRVAGVVARGVPAEIVAMIAAERVAYGRMSTLTATAATRLRKLRDADSRRSLSFLDGGRAVGLGADAIAALLLVGGAFVFGKRARSRERQEQNGQRRQEFDSALHEALEMAKREADAYAVMAAALHQAVPDLQVEMLVADSSHANFAQTLAVGNLDEPRRGCGVQSPLDCPATARGQTLVFSSSREMSACPHLKGRDSGELSAACVAVSVTGMTVGVVHAMSADGAPPSPDEIAQLEATSRQASERIAMLRAFEKSETQARTDPLTGLWNRRSLENRVYELRSEGTPYALAYGDLDHFKALNDTHGHEAGDQALRLFSRVLRDAIRPTDVAARYGGEEFVVVLPECTPATAAEVLDRLRERLALTLASGRVPAFTVSFGIAASVDGDTFDEVVAVADHALMAAKTDGRNRTIVAGGPSAPVRYETSK